MAENLVLDGLLEVFPHIDFSTLIEVSIQFKDDIDRAADYVIQNVLPNVVDIHPNTNEDIHGHQQAFDDTNTQLGLDPDNTASSSVQFDQTNKTAVEKEDTLMEKQLKPSLTGLCPEVFDVPSTSGQNCISEEFSSDCLLADSHLHASSERYSENSASEGDMSLHDDGSPHVALRSSYSFNLEALDNVIADEHYKKNALMSNVAAISEMLQEVELNEKNTKRAISEASLAGNDILVKVEELKEMTTLAVENNNKVAGEIFAEKSILETEAQELQTRLFNISEETKSFVLTIDEMHNTLQTRLAAAEAERVAAEKAKLEREALAQKSLKEQELSLEAAQGHYKRLEQQAQENAKLRELLTDRGHVVDALHGEMLGIFESITQLKPRVDMQLPVDEQWQHVSSILSSTAVDETVQQVPVVLSSSAVDKPLQQPPSILSSSAVDEPLRQVSPISVFDEQLHQVSSILSSSVSSILSSSAYDKPLQLVSSRLSSSVRSARSDGSFVASLASKSSWSSAEESNVSLMDDERTAGVSVGDFALDDSWDVVDDVETIEAPIRVKSTPMLL
ncbi:hypothetical protein SETIT_3G252600v2 [Setaria italica]|uniref:CUE domain-containing protein n=2 Tax=Setaria italica TaxID=4555 RepID=K3Z514_SETIT|nr:uncharacterized protein LOC101777817 [Setaria italica]XP_022680908.1 uncharacterized protein LOC101777817 [Setaria italica]RCV17846.1 hypothetical protein SETIT_3G252600v2 [Setaria italica]